MKLLADDDKLFVIELTEFSFAIALVPAAQILLCAVVNRMHRICISIACMTREEAVHGVHGGHRRGW